MRARVLVPFLLTLAACTAGPPAEDTDTDARPPLPLGLTRTPAGETLAGVAVVDLTPNIPETFDDVNGNHLFDGCYDTPGGGGACGDETFSDADGNGRFDAVFIGGYSPERPALGVHDRVTARAIVLEDGGEVVALVSLDLVGLAHPRIDEASAILAAEDGLDADHLIITSTHNHQGPDTMGLWGDPLAGIPGFREDYQERVVDAIVEAVRTAAAGAERVDLRVGAVNLRDVSPYFNGSVFGGVNPTAKMHGMIHDIRDPVVVSDQLLVVQARAADSSAAVFTLTSWSGHPEVRGGDNSDISADWVGEMRALVEAHYGGTALHVPESLGGMQSALGGDLPLVDEDGNGVFETCTAGMIVDELDGCVGKTEGAPRTYVDGPADGLPIPVWAEHDSWDFVRSHAHHIAQAAYGALDAGEDVSGAPLRVLAERAWVPVRNEAYNLLGPSGIFDLGLDAGTFDAALCPQAPETQLGCLPIRVYRLQLGPVSFASAPGELVPELSWGLPTDDPRWVAEAADPTKRGPGSAYFPQHDPDCDAVSFASCVDALDVGDCDCLSLHAWPYAIAVDPETRPVLAALDTKYKAAMSMTSTYLSYILPEPSVNHEVSLLSDRDGDHYEDTVTVAWDFGSVYLRTWWKLDARWDATFPPAEEE